MATPGDERSPLRPPEQPIPVQSAPQLTTEERKEVRRRQHKLRSRILYEKVQAIHERRQALSYTTIFYFLALHKLEQTLFSAMPLVVRQAIFVLFTNQVIAYGCRMKQLMQFKNSADLKKRGEPTWKLTLEWMVATERAIARALDLTAPEDKFVLRVIKGLEELVDLTLFPDDVLRRKKTHGVTEDVQGAGPLGSSSRNSGGDPSSENVILNPMFAKRLLLNFAESFRTELNTKLKTPQEQQPEQPPKQHEEPVAPPPALSTDNDNLNQSHNSMTEDTEKIISQAADSKQCHRTSLATRSLRKLTTLNFTRPGSFTVSSNSIESSGPDQPDCWSLKMTMDSLLTIQRNASKLNTATIAVIDDIAERIRHLPTLTAELLANAEPPRFNDTVQKMLSLDNVVRRNLTTGTNSSAAVNNNESAHSDSESEVTEKKSAAESSDSDEYMHIALDTTGQKCEHLSEGASADCSFDFEEELDLNTSLTTYFEAVGDVINLQVILLWSVFFRLLLDGIWNSGVERVCKDVARNLDVHDQFIFMLIAYAADAVCDAVHGAAASDNGDSDHKAPDVVVDSTTGEAIAVGTSLADVGSTRLKQLAKKRHSQNVKRGLKIAGMTVGVGALSALTAGLAAPAFAAGFGALGIAGTSSLTAFLGSAGGAASLASVFGASSASLSGWKYSRRLADIRVCGFVKLDNDNSNHSMDAISGYIHEIIEYKQCLRSAPLMDRRNRYAAYKPISRLDLGVNSALLRRPLGLQHLRPEYSPGCKRTEPPFRLTVGVSGWLREKDNTQVAATAGWQFLRDCLGAESYVFEWEPQLLKELGFMMVRLLSENVAYQAATLSIQLAVSASAGFIMWPVSFIQYAAQLDNAWLTAKERAQQAGVILAAAICDKAIVGNRPVTLIGCSMGSRVITYCLKELYDRREQFRVADVILMGLPDGKNKEDWRKMRSVVTGRLINVYNSSDFILIFLYRWMEWGVSVAGLSSVEGVPGVENFDASALVQSHYQYEEKSSDILAILKIHSSVVKYI